ncbi:MAG TPA: DNA-3-methyladenine glycosylase [Terriglobales bacterium]|nr:DNA-3-methyladenine glycosylase [Terriglobales bacterium]
MPKLDHHEAVEHLKAADPKLALLIEKVGECRFEVRSNLNIYESLLRSITYQQLAGTAAAAILKRVQAVFHDGDRYPTPEQILSAPEEVLRSAGLSRNKMMAIKDLAQKTVDGLVPTRTEARRLTDGELIERLTPIRGIGVWTVEMLLIFGLGRPDVLPVTDYGVRKGFQRTFKTRELPTAKQLLRRGEKWRPYRSIASWYLWRAAEM